jgi:ABC-type sulfate transport system permease component
VSTVVVRETGTPTPVERRGRRTPAWLTFLGLPALLLLALPVIVLVLRGIGSGSVLAAIASPSVLDALTLSALTTVVSVGVVFVIGMRRSTCR